MPCCSWGILMLRVIIMQVRKTSGSHLVQPPVKSVVSLRSEQVAQGIAQTSLGNLQGWRLHSLSGQPALWFDGPDGEDALPCVQSEPFFQAMSGVFCSCTMQCCEELGSVCSVTFLWVVEGCISKALSFPRWISPIPSALSLQSNCSQLFDNLDGLLQNQLNCLDTWLEPQTECSALEWICCALRSAIPGFASCAPAAQPRVHPAGSCSVCCCLPAPGPFWHTSSLWSSQGLFLPRCKASLL